MTVIDKIARAKTKLMVSQPFFSVLAFGMPTIEADWCETMATDGRNIFYNAEWTESLHVDEVAGVLCHEVLHAAFHHPLIIGNRDHKLWNIACDFAINPIVLGCKGMRLPGVAHKADSKSKEAGYLLDPKFKDMAASQVYALLLQEAKEVQMRFDGRPQEGEGEGEGPQIAGGVVEPQTEDGKALSQADLKEAQAEQDLKTQEAAGHAKKVGNLPGSLEGLVKAVGKPKVDWHNYLQSWLKGTRPDDYTWRRPNRRMFAAHGIYMPTMEFRGVGKGIVSFDVSGSVLDQELVFYLTEVLGMVGACKPEEVHLIQHDTFIRDVKILDGQEENFSELAIKGRGGTNIQPSFDYVEKLDFVPDWFIAFTDMGIYDFPSEAPDYPVIWCSTGGDQAPFGQVVMLKDPLDRL